MRKISIFILRLCLLIGLTVGLVFQPQGSVHAAANLTITPDHLECDRPG